MLAEVTPAHTTPPALWGQCPGPSRFGAHTQLAQVPISRVTRCFCSILPSKQSCKVQKLGEETNTILRVWTAERLQTQSTSVSSHPAVTLLWDAPCPPHCSRGLSRAEPPSVGTALAVCPPTAPRLAWAIVAIFRV